MSSIKMSLNFVPKATGYQEIGTLSMLASVVLLRHWKKKIYANLHMKRY